MGLFWAWLALSHPDGVGQVEVSDDTGAVTVELRVDACWKRRAIAKPSDPYAHLHKRTTAFMPKLTFSFSRQTCLWTGSLESTHETSQDTVVNYALLLQWDPDAEVQSVVALWHEDHQQVPTLLFTGAGRLHEGTLDLMLSGGELADDARLSGHISSL